MKPENELEVMLLFAQESKNAGAKIISATGKFPDAIISWNEVEYKVEFEYKAMNFRNHQHDPRKCDLIICWEDDYPDSVLPVIPLSEDNWIFLIPGALPSKAERAAAYWKQRTEIAETKIASLKSVIEELTKEPVEINYLFECSHCDMAFASQQGLNAHQRVHSNGSEPVPAKEEIA